MSEESKRFLAACELERRSFVEATAMVARAAGCFELAQAFEERANPTGFHGRLRGSLFDEPTQLLSADRALEALSYLYERRAR